jgi:hypothetical protein
MGCRRFAHRMNCEAYGSEFPANRKPPQTAGPTPCQAGALRSSSIPLRRHGLVGWNLPADSGIDIMQRQAKGLDIFGNMAFVAPGCIDGQTGLADCLVRPLPAKCQSPEKTPRPAKRSVPPWSFEELRSHKGAGPVRKASNVDLRKSCSGGVSSCGISTPVAAQISCELPEAMKARVIPIASSRKLSDSLHLEAPRTEGAFFVTLLGPLTAPTAHPSFEGLRNA